jgi:uncharacterized protein (DUF433 family)
MTPNQYVEQRGEGWYIAGTRVSLDSIVYAFRQGFSAETIASECYTTLTLEEVYGAIAFYLANREAVDAYLVESEVKAEAWAREHARLNPKLAEKIAKGRRERLLKTAAAAQGE